MQIVQTHISKILGKKKKYGLMLKILGHLPYL